MTKLRFINHLKKGGVGTQGTRAYWGRCDVGLYTFERFVYRGRHKNSKKRGHVPGCAHTAKVLHRIHLPDARRSTEGYSAPNSSSTCVSAQRIVPLRHGYEDA